MYPRVYLGMVVCFSRLAMRSVVAAYVCACVWAVVVADICDRRDRRTERRWKGDFGDLTTITGGVRDRLQVRVEHNGDALS